MKTTLELPDDLYQQVKIRAAQQNRRVKDLVSDGLRLLLGTPAQGQPDGATEEQRLVLRALEEIRRSPPSPPGRKERLIADATRLRREGWNREHGAP